MFRAKIERRCIPCARTIRRAEETGRKPIDRYAFGLSQFYGVSLHDIWPVAKRERVAA